MTTGLRIVAVNAGLSEPSSTRLLIDRTLAAVVDDLSRGHDIEAEVEVIDLREHAVELGRAMTVGFASGEARDALDAVESADALIVATPVFNASYSGLFKMFFDLVDIDAMTGTPVLIGATGGSARHSMVLDHALRPLFAYLRAVVTPTGVYAASADWAGADGDTATLNDRIDRAATELAALIAPRAAPAGDTGEGRVPAAANVAAGARRADPTAPRHASEAAGIANFARLLGTS
ncbi:oxidoreductase [Gordonia jinghuaiqii]|uniref:NAD(P)H-dependent oxidoreductase n=1 Tax=Gordonia jinghuaiqii TaxID=2758710 RepID=A0A7D7R1V4_9ACTN|nr:CE1759 family FMN reductase [Gordonia jinghuaiqii]MCR5979489.1 oxidoreductase [Gordonia jinghuaiqii]QMT00712.1 NAD(P)H-dependent oxidoreductase [Gordonia jinghuaiqii]